MIVIPDSEIPTASPEALIEAFTPWVRKLANRYKPYLEMHPVYDIEDLMQGGKMGLLKAQSTYDPETGHRFINWSVFYIKNGIRSELRVWRKNDEPDEPVLSLDAPIPGTEDITLGNSLALADPDPTAEERLSEESERQEFSAEVQEAVERLGNDKYREVITRIFLKGQTTDQVAADMGLTQKQIQMASQNAREQLKMDYKFRKLAFKYYNLKVGVSTFNSTNTSATELAILLRERDFDSIYGEGAFVKYKMWRYENDDQIGTRLYWKLQRQRNSI